VPFKIVERPPIFVVRRVGVASPADMAFMLERARVTLADSPRPCVLVYDAGRDPSGRPDARSRQLTAEWMKANEALLRERCAGCDFAFPNPLSRGVLTAILWLRSPPFEARLHGSCAEALASAARKSRAPLDIQGLIRELGDAMPATG
jgi:hypothetical protein